MSSLPNRLFRRGAGVPGMRLTRRKGHLVIDVHATVDGRKVSTSYPCRPAGPLAVVVLTAAAVATAVAVDAGLFAAGVAALGFGPAIVAALVIAAARLLGLTEGALRADLLERTGARGGASGLHKVSDA